MLRTTSCANGSSAARKLIVRTTSRYAYTLTMPLTDNVVTISTISVTQTIIFFRIDQRASTADLLRRPDATQFGELRGGNGTCGPQLVARREMPQRMGSR